MVSVPAGVVVAGVDPGGRYTGLVVRDGDQPLFAETVTRGDDEPAHVYAARVTETVLCVLGGFSDAAVVGVEGVNSPSGFANGQKAFINPKGLIHAAMVFGAVTSHLPDCVVVPPGRNGSRVWYPPELLGRRPKDLPGEGGAGTRAHEQSAYDVAGRAWKASRPV